MHFSGKVLLDYNTCLWYMVWKVMWTLSKKINLKSVIISPSYIRYSLYGKCLMNYSTYILFQVAVIVTLSLTNESKLSIVILRDEYTMEFSLKILLNLKHVYSAQLRSWTGRGDNEITRLFHVFTQEIFSFACKLMKCERKKYLKDFYEYWSQKNVIFTRLKHIHWRLWRADTDSSDTPRLHGIFLNSTWNEYLSTCIISLHRHYMQ